METEYSKKGKEVIETYYETKQIIPLEICILESGNRGYYYHFLPEFNPLCFPQLKPSDIATDLIDASEKTVNSISYLTHTSTATDNGKEVSEMTEDQCICLAWVILWCATLWYQAPEEHSFRLNQVLEILMLMKEKDWTTSIDTFQLIMQTCLNYGLPEMVIEVYNSLPLYNVKANGNICSIYFKARIQQSTSQQKVQGSVKHAAGTTRALQRIDIRKLTKGNLDLKSATYKSSIQYFKERTFFNEEELSIMGDRVIITGDNNQCPECDTMHTYEDLRKIMFSINDTKKDVIEVNCSNCNAVIIPNIHVRIGNRYTFAEPDVPTYMEKAVILMFPREYKRNVERLALQSNTTVKIEVKKFKAFYQGIFWNSIWHFSKLNLPYDLFLPYKKDIYFEGLIQSVSQVTISAVKNWEAEDKNELTLQKKYEENMKKKISYKHMGTQVSETDISKLKKIKQ